MFILGPTDNGNTTDLGSSSVDKRKTVDSQFDTSASHFSGNRAVSDNQASVLETTVVSGVMTNIEYTDIHRTRGGAPNRVENPVEDTTKDVDDPNDLRARKRFESLQRERSTLEYRKDLEYVSSSAENRPPEDTDAFIPELEIAVYETVISGVLTTVTGTIPLKRRSKLKGQYGDGQYDNMPNRGYESELS